MQQRHITMDGFEMTFQTNHLGHFLLTNLLLDSLKKSKSRIINVSSAAHQAGRLNFEDLQWTKRSYSSFRAYADAKLCNIYFPRELHRRYNVQGITAYSLHPGVVASNFAGDSSGILHFVFKAARPFMISTEKGAKTQLYLATAPDIEKFSGKYFVKSKPARESTTAINPKISARLWEESERLLAGFL